MLKNLIKYEWKAVWKVFVIINAFTVLTTIVGMLILQSLKNGYYHKTSAITAFLFIMYYLTIVSVSSAMSIYTGIRFYRNLFTDEGYLMHTLPVTKRQLVVSKLLIHTLCLLVTEIIVILSVGLLLLPLFAWMLDEPDLFLSSLLTNLAELMRSAEFSLPVLLLSGIVSTVIGMFSGVLGIYCAVTLGQTFHRHKVMGSILCYIGIYFLTQSVNNVLLLPQINMITNAKFNPMTYLTHVINMTAITSLILGIVWYCIILFIMNNKLNLD